MGLSTACNRLGRLPHILGFLGCRAFQVVITPPDKALHLMVAPLHGLSAIELGPQVLE